MTTLELTPISIGDTLITPSDFCAALRQRSLHEYQATVDQVADYYLVRNACDRLGISASEQELQEAADQFRRAHDLLSASDTGSWLEYKNLSVDDLERNVEFNILSRKLLEHEYGATALADHFDSSIHKHTWAALSVLSVESEDLANDLAKQLRKNPGSFATLAREHSVEADTAGAGGMLGWTSLDKIPAALRDPVRASAGGDEIVGPVASGGTWHLVQVAAIEKGVYGPEHEQGVMAELIDQWLRAERQRVTIEYPAN